MDKQAIIKKLLKGFIAEDKIDPFGNREYAKETRRIFEMLISYDELNLKDETDEAIYDIVDDIFRYFKKTQYHFTIKEEN